MKMKNSKKHGNAENISGDSAARLSVSRILVTTDFSGNSLPGVRYALWLGKKIGASFDVLHVIEPAFRLSGMESVVLARTDSEVAAQVHPQLVSLARRETKGKGDLKVVSIVRTGKPFHEITLAARERAADLIVIATHGHTGLKRVFLGSTAEHVVRHAPCPVLTIPTRQLPKASGKAPAFKLRRILVPIDFSKTSRDALPYAALLAGHFDSEIIILHVVEKFPIDHLLGSGVTNETIVPMKIKARADLENLAANLSESTHLHTSAVVRDGTPYEEICRAAKTMDADLIILTTHGYTGLNRLWLGSTAERVVRHASCPVLAVRELNRMTG